MIETLEDRAVPAAFYDLTARADTSETLPASFTRFGDLVSLNNDGAIAFVGFTDEDANDEPESGLWLDDPAEVFPVNVNPSFSDTNGRDFGRAVDLNDLGRLAARDRIGTEYFVRTWSSVTPDERTNIASANNIYQDDYGRFSALQTFVDVNDRGDVAFVGLDAEGTSRDLMVKLAAETEARTLFPVPVQQTLPQPRLTENGRVLYRAGASSLKLVDPVSNQTRQVATGFSELGYAPGISRDGRLVAFLGNKGQGLGVYLAYEKGGKFETVRIAGAGQDGWQSFELTDAVRVNNTLMTERGVTVAFEGVHATLGRGIYTVRVSFIDPDGPAEFDPDFAVPLVHGAAPVARVGDSTGTGIISDVEFYNGLNDRNRGEVAFWAQTNNGEAVVRAEPFQVVHAQFNPVGASFAGASSRNLKLLEQFGITNVGWSSNYGPAMTAAGFNDLANARTALVARVQGYFDNVDARVRVVETAPAFVPRTAAANELGEVAGAFQTVYIGGLALQGAADDDKYGMASPTYQGQGGIDFFNQIVDDTSLVFANRIMASFGAFENPSAASFDKRLQALASITAHEIGHNFGLFHLSYESPSTASQIMRGATDTDAHLTIGATFLAGSPFPRQSYTDSQNTGYTFGSERSDARLRFGAGSTEPLLPADAPNTTVLQSAGLMASRANMAFSPAGGPASARLIVGVHNRTQGDALPVFQDLGSGGVGQLLSGARLAHGAGAEMILLGSTDGSRLDVVGVPLGTSMDLATLPTGMLGLAADARLRAVVEPGSANSGFQLYHVPVAGAPVLMGTVQVQGVPQARVSTPGGPVASGSIHGLGETTLAGAPITQAITIRNTGSGPLNLGTVTIGGPGYSVTQPGQTSLAPGAETTATVTLSSATGGVGITGTLTIPSNDPVGPFVLTLRGTVDARPRVLGVSRIDGGTGPLKVAIDFSSPLEAGPAADKGNFALSSASGAGVVLASAAYSESGGQFRVTLTATVAGTALADGDYTVRFDGTQVLAAGGVPFASADNELLVMGGYSNPTVTRIGRGDDGTVQMLDGPTREGFGPAAQIAAADFNRDGSIDVAALSELTGEVVFHLGRDDGTYEEPVIYPLPPFNAQLAAAPRSILSADWNADGHPDLFVHDFNAYFDNRGERIHVLLNDGRGGFTPAPETPIPLPTDADGYAHGPLFAVGEFTGDSLPDIVIGGLPVEGAIYNYTAKGSIRVIGKDPFLGYSVAATLSTGEEEWYPYRASTADLNGDGRLDLVVDNSGFYLKFQRPVVYLSSPTGLMPARAFPRGDPFTFPPVPGTLDYGQTAVADFTGDGRPDIALVGTRMRDFEENYFIHEPIRLMVNDGQGWFTMSDAQDLDHSGSIAGVADFNGDGYQDILLRCEAAEAFGPFEAVPELSLWTLLGDGAGQFAPLGAPSSIAGGGIPAPGNFVVADLTGDGKPDALYGNTLRGPIGLATNNGLGVLSAPASAGPQNPSLSEFSSYHLRTESAATIADLNRDGLPDELRIATIPGYTYIGEGVDVRLGQPDGGTRLVNTVPLVVEYSPGGYLASDIQWLRVGDLNNDGWPDLVVGTRETVAVRLGIDGTRFGPQTLFDAGALGQPSSGTLVDVNRDGKLDLLAHLLGSPAGFGVFFGTGTGTLAFNSNSFRAVPGLVGYETHFPVVVDVTGDGKVDLIATSTDSGTGSFVDKLAVFVGQGNGLFTPGFELVTGDTGTPEIIKLAQDVTGDGHLDLVTARFNELHVFTGNGAGQFAADPGRTVVLSDSAGNVIAADLTGDGKLDLAVAIYTNYIPSFVSTVTLLPGDDVGHFGPEQLVDTTRLNPASLTVVPVAGTVEAGSFAIDHPVLSATPGAADLTATTRGRRAVTIDPHPLLSTLTADPVVTAVTVAPQHGVVTVDPRGTPADQTDDTFVYVAAAGFVGTDQFTYLAADGRGGSVTGVVTVTVNPLPTIAFESPSFIADRGPSFAIITVVRSGDVASEVVVNYGAVDGTAVEGVDYLGEFDTLTFAAGETSKTFDIRVLASSATEDRTVQLTLDPAGDAVLGMPATATLILPGDPALRSTFQFSAESYLAGPGATQAVVTVTRSDNVDRPAQVAYSTANGTAVAGLDYTATSGMIAFAAGQSSKTFNVPIINNPAADDVRTVLLSLAPVQSATIGTVGTAVLFLTPPRTSVFTVPEDSKKPTGATVTSLVGPFYSDADGSTLNGIAVFGATGTTDGTWQFSTNGKKWVNLGPVSPTAARLLRGTDQLRFVPAVDYVGLPSVQFRAWDQSTGTAGGLANLTASGAIGGAGAFSTDTGRAVAAISPSNDRPVLDIGGSPAMTPVDPDDTNPPGDTVADLLGSSVTDVDGTAGTGLAVTGARNGNGSWQYRTAGTTTWEYFDLVSPKRAKLLGPTDRIRFVPDPFFPGPAPKLTFVAWDRTTGRSGDVMPLGKSTAFSKAAETLPPLVTETPPVANTAPVLNAGPSPTLTSVNEDERKPVGDPVSRLIGTAVVDPDIGSLRGVAITGLSGTANGSWQFSTNGGKKWTTMRNASLASAVLLRDTDWVRFVSNANYHGSAGLTFRAWDRTRGAAGARADLTVTNATGGDSPFSTTEDSATITVLAVNDRPVFAKGYKPLAVPVLPGTPEPPGQTVESLLSAGVTDPDVGALRGMAVVLAVPDGWQVRRGGGGWVSLEDASHLSARLLDAADEIRFVPSASVKTAQLGFHAWDQTAGTPGDTAMVVDLGTSVTVAGLTAKLAINSVNERPVLTKGNYSLSPSAAFPFVPAGDTVATILAGQASDPDPGTALGIAIIGLTPAGGMWQFSLDGNSWSDLTSATPQAALMLRGTDWLRFVPASGFRGMARLSFVAWDQTGTVPGTTGDTTTRGTVAFSKTVGTALAVVNTAPELAES